MLTVYRVQAESGREVSFLIFADNARKLRNKTRVIGFVEVARSDERGGMMSDDCSRDVLDMLRHARHVLTFFVHLECWTDSGSGT